MKKMYYLLAVAFVGFLLLATTRHSTEGKYGMTVGTPEIKSITSLSFGPEGVLFIGDSKSAMIFAVDTKDATVNEKAANVEIKGVDQKIAALLGTEVQNITIQDIAVNPASKE